MTGGGIVLATAIMLAGSEWGYAPNEQPLVANGQEVFLQFASGGRVSGASGCNAFSGSYVEDGASLTLDGLASTKMFCQEPGVMDAERKFLQMLRDVRTADATHLKLVLKNGEGSTLAVLIRRDWD